MRARRKYCRIPEIVITERSIIVLLRILVANRLYSLELIKETACVSLFFDASNDISKLSLSFSVTEMLMSDVENPAEIKAVERIFYR